MMTRFLKHEGGNIAILTSVMLIVVVVFAGIAVDSGRIQELRSETREAADSALLAAVRAKVTDSSLSEADMTAIARRIFLANGGDAIDLNSLTVQQHGTDGSYELVVEGSAPTFLLNIVGIDTLDVDASPVVTAGPPNNIELVLVLDNTRSMQGSRIDALRVASQNLIDQIVIDGNDRVRVGIVPFGRHVNVGIANGSQPWVRVPADDTTTINVCQIDTVATEAQGCVISQSTCPRTDGVLAPCTVVNCPAGLSQINTCSNQTRNLTWYGCVGSRDEPLNIEDTDYDTDPVPGVLNYENTFTNRGDCPSEITPLTSTKSVLNDAIAALITQGNTYVPGGLAWGYRALTNAAPYAEGKTNQELQNLLGRKVLVLMTDGANTASPNYFFDGGQRVAWHYGSDSDLADDTTEALCDEIKDNDIEVFTVAFEVTEKQTLNLLRKCATSPSRFFDASDSDEFIEAFDAIAQSVSELRLSR